MLHIEERLSSFARLITQNFDMKVHFAGQVPSITTNEMFIPPLEDTPLAFQRAKFFVAHESGHELFSVMDLKEKASKENAWLPHILNSLEDARTERKMVKKLEGLKDDFDVNVKQIIDEWDVDKMPLHTQVLHGLYLRGKELDTTFLSKEANEWLDKLSIKIQRAVTGKDSHVALVQSRIIHKVIKNLLPSKPPKQSGNQLSGNGTGYQSMGNLRNSWASLI